MKSKQILSFEQMHHLQELGLVFDYDTLYLYVKFEDTDWLLKPFSDLNIIGISCKYIPAYTLQDVLDVLPKRIYDKGAFYLGCYDIMIDEYDICYAKWCGAEIESTYVEMEIKDNLIDAAYSMLCWCIEQGYVETNKNK